MHSNTNVLVVVPRGIYEKDGAREALGLVNVQVMSELFGSHMKLMKLDLSVERTLLNTLQSLFGFLNGVSFASIRKLCQTIQDDKIDMLFIEGSNLGLLAKYVKRSFPKIKIAIFFHNIEAKFFFDAWKFNKSIRNFSIVVANYFAESAAVRYGDLKIVLNTRDGDVLYRIYGDNRYLISGFYVPEQKQDNLNLVSPLPGIRYCIFVGGAFYANVEGVFWFAEKVAPFINAVTVVIGRGFENYSDKLSRFRNIHVIGTVNELAPWYSNAEFVVSPIFKGSGMKTKVAEALYYGKRVIGTSESFVGYESFVSKIGFLCNTKNEFIQSINYMLAHKRPLCEIELVGIYKRYFSYKSYKSRMKSNISRLTYGT